MTSSEAELFENKEYDKFNKMADDFNTEHGYGYGKIGRFGRSGYRGAKKRKRITHIIVDWM